MERSRLEWSLKVGIEFECKDEANAHHPREKKRLWIGTTLSSSSTLSLFLHPEKLCCIPHPPWFLIIVYSGCSENAKAWTKSTFLVLVMSSKNKCTPFVNFKFLNTLFVAKHHASHAHALIATAWVWVCCLERRLPQCSVQGNVQQRRLWMMEQECTSHIYIVYKFQLRVEGCKSPPKRLLRMLVPWIWPSWESCVLDLLALFTHHSGPWLPEELCLLAGIGKQEDCKCHGLR